MYAVIAVIVLSLVATDSVFSKKTESIAEKHDWITYCTDSSYVKNVLTEDGINKRILKIGCEENVSFELEPTVLFYWGKRVVICSTEAAAKKSMAFLESINANKPPGAIFDVILFEPSWHAKMGNDLMYNNIVLYTMFTDGELTTDFPKFEHVATLFWTFVISHQFRMGLFDHESPLNQKKNKP